MKETYLLCFCVGQVGLLFMNAGESQDIFLTTLDQFVCFMDDLLIRVSGANVAQTNRWPDG